MRYSLLAKVSGEEQVEGYSLDAQVRAFNTLVEAREGSVYHQWIEEGVSARTDDISKRPHFRRAIDEALAGRYDVLVVHKLDRFSRNVRITLEYLEKLEKAGVGFVSITEQMDFSTPIGRVILANLAAFRQYYSDNLSAEVSKGLKERAAQGLWVGPVPFGYAKGDDGSLEIVPGEAEAVQQVFSMYASGNKTYREIATWLNQSVHETRSRRRDVAQRRYLWTRYSVSGILTNPFYLGQVRYKGQLLPGNHPPLVSQELFDAVQGVRKEHRTTPATFARRYRTYLLKGLVRCVSCGGKVWAQHVKGQDYYREENTSRGLDCPNGRTYQRAGVLDEQVCAIIGDLRLPNSWRELVSGYLASDEERKKESNERRRLEEKLRRIRVQYREGDIDRREYQQESALTKAALDATRVSVDDEVVRYGDHIEGLVEAWGAATLEERHQLLTIMLDAVYVDMAQGVVLGLKPKPEFLPLFNLGEPVTTGDSELVTGGMEQGRTLQQLNLWQDLPWTEAREEMGGTEFPLRTDKRYYAQRIREFNATKSVLGNRVNSSQDTIASEAHREHFDDLLSLAREWKEHLVFDVGDDILVQDSLLPSSFAKGDADIGWHTGLPVVWLVGHDGQVDVWMALERRERLFGALLEHLPSEVGDTYEALKSEVAAGIKMAADSLGRIQIPEVTNLVFALAEKLDEVLDSRVLGGNCKVCRRIAGEGVI